MNLIFFFLIMITIVNVTLQFVDEKFSPGIDWDDFKRFYNKKYRNESEEAIR